MEQYRKGEMLMLFKDLDKFFINEIKEYKVGRLHVDHGYIAKENKFYVRFINPIYRNKRVGWRIDFTKDPDSEIVVVNGIQRGTKTRPYSIEGRYDDTIPKMVHLMRGWADIYPILDTWVVMQS